MGNQNFLGLIAMGISQKTAEKLDILNGGKKDKIIENSVFEEIKECVHTIRGQGEVSILLDLLEKLKKGCSQVIKVIYDDLVKIAGKSEICKQHKKSSWSKMVVLSQEAYKHIQKKGSIKGFQFKGLPLGIIDVQITKKEENSSADNDTLTFNKNGKAVIKRNKETSYTLEYTWFDGTKSKIPVPLM